MPSGITNAHGLVLSLVVHRRMTYREVAARLERPPGEVLRMLRDALSWIGDLDLDRVRAGAEAASASAHAAPLSDRRGQKDVANNPS